MIVSIAYHSCRTCGRTFGVECQDCGVPKVESERHPRTYEEEYQSREMTRLQRELAEAQAEIKRLKTPPPKAPSGESAQGLLP